MRQEFVIPFDETSTRHQLYIGYLHYNKGLKELLDIQNCIQWINGSFISTRVNPNDIDVVNLLDYRLVERYEKQLKSFINSQSREKYGVDAYIVKLYPIGHEKYIRTKSDLLYWEH